MRTQLLLIVLLGSFVLAVTTGCKKDSDETPVAKTISGNIDGPATWSHSEGLAVDYLVTGQVNVNADLTVQPGTIIQMDPGASLVIAESGSLNATGSSGAMVTITGSATALKAGGKWNSIVFYSRSAKNALHFCHLKLGGAGDLVTPDAMVVVGQNSFAEGKVSIRDCVFDGSAGNGLFINDQSEVTGFTNNTFSNNAKFPVSLTNENLNDLNAGNTFNANGKNYVEIRDCVFPTGESQAWKKMPVPYFIGQQVRLMGEYTLEAGTEVYFSAQGYLNVWDGNSSARLIAAGTASEYITFGPDPTSSDFWQGIGIASSGTSFFQYCRFVNGGGNENIYGQQASLTMEGNTQSTLEIRDCVFDNSLGYGIDLGGIGNYNQDIETANTFNNCAKGNIKY